MSQFNMDLPDDSLAELDQFVNYEISRWKVADDENNPCGDNLHSEGPPIRKIFVANINERISQYDLRNLFRHFGKIVDCHISRDQYTGNRKHFGFITFKHPEDAMKALNANPEQLRLYHRVLHVAPADSWHQPKELPDGTIEWKPRRRPLREKVPASSATYAAESEAVARVCQAEEDIDESKCQVHLLNDDCLMHIFSFLCKKERVKIERVCKRWQTVSLNMWVYLQHLEFSTMFSSRSGQFLTMNILRGLLQRCGPNLASLDLSHKPHDLNSRVMHLIAKFTPNLHCLNLAGISLATYSIRTLAQISGQLQELSLDSCSGAQERDLQLLFQQCPVLEVVTLSRNNHLTGKCLGRLPSATLRELILDECNNLHVRHLLCSLRGLSNLQTLSINSCINLTSSDVSEIIKAAPGLVSLSVARYFPLLSGSALCSVHLLRDLISLNLQLNPAVNDQVMETIAKSCSKIEQLDITGCSIPSSGEIESLTNVGIKALAKLPRLVNLSMSYMNNVSDEALDAIGDKGLLKILVCRGCPTFTDAGCMRVVALCNDLEKFDMSGCDNVTNVTIEAALEAVKLRTNKVKLRIIAGGTQVRKEDITEEVPLLHLDMSNYCIAHLRPDFVDDIYFPSSDIDDESDEYVIDDLIEIDWGCQSMFLGDDTDCYDFFDELYGPPYELGLDYDYDSVDE